MTFSGAGKWTALGATAVVLVAVFAHGWGVAVHDPQRSTMTTVHAVERGDDYAAWMRVFAPRGHVGVFYTANDTPDRVLLVRLGEIDALLRGDAVTPLIEFERPREIPHASLGRIDFAAPSPTCPPPTGGCIDETMPVLVWLKGDAWRGATSADATYYTILGEDWDGPISETEAHEGPVSPSVSRTRESIVANAPFWLGLAAIAAAVGLLGALTHAILEMRRTSRGPLVPTAPRAESTETMLMLARVTTLYVDAIRRSFRVSLAAIVGITAAVMFFALPPMLERVSQQFRYMWGLMELHVAFFVLAPVYVMCVALLFWWAAYWRVRAELKEWRRRTRGFEDEASQLVGA